MSTKKRTSKKNRSNQETGHETGHETGREIGPEASRPYMPGYGVPKDKKGLLPWSHVTERMAEAQNYWVCTVSPDGRPHATPVWGMWVDDRLYFGGSAQTRRNRNLAENPAVCVHLESGSDVVIVHGDAQELRAPDRSLVTRLIEVSTSKYGYAPKPEDYETTPGTYVLRPRWVLAWSQMLKDATRWNFQESD